MSESQRFSEISTGRKIGRLAGWLVVALIVLNFFAGFIEIGAILSGF